MLDCPVARYMVTAKFDCDLTVKSIGSETASAPFGMTVKAFPLNVSVLSVLVWISLVPAAPFAGKATATEVMGRSVVPNAFEIRMRMRLAPTVIYTVWRRVELGKTPLFLVCERPYS